MKMLTRVKAWFVGKQGLFSIKLLKPDKTITYHIDPLTTWPFKQTVLDYTHQN